MNMKTIVLITLALAVAALTGCRTVPVSGRTQLMLSGEDYENSLGEDAFKEYKQKYKVSTNQAQNQALKRVGDAVRSGEAIAITGENKAKKQSGLLHFELWQDGKPLNPENFIIF